ncbi:MAG: hypothetical protein ABEJ60_00780 [Halodesulfurarchaeum sp.]
MRDRFAGEDRGVSGVVGFILIFAIVMILLSIYQAQVVPAQNEKVEFQHFTEVRDDLIRLHSAISTAGQANVPQFPTVTLGTDYPPRVLAVNPPPASGILRTSEAYNITITDETGTTRRVPTRFLVYRPHYHYLDVGSTWYENSVLYLEVQDGGGVVILEEQGLVVGGSRLRITALQNDFQRSGSKTVTVALYPSNGSGISLSDLEGELDVTLPTRLTGEEYWNGAFEDSAFDPTVDEDWYETGVHALNFTVPAENLLINTVGIQSMPEEQTAKLHVGIGDSGTDNAPPSVQILSSDVDRTGNSGKYAVSVTFDGADPDGDISSYTVTLYDSGERETRIDTASSTYSGGEKTVTLHDESPQEHSPPYWVVVTVTDSQGASATAEKQVATE